MYHVINTVLLCIFPLTVLLVFHCPKEASFIQLVPYGTFHLRKSTLFGGEGVENENRMLQKI